MRRASFHKFVWGSATQGMHFRRLVRAGFALMVATFSNFAEGQAANLLANSSFENTSAAPWKLSWKRTEAAVTQTDSVDGTHALAMPTDGEASQEISLRSGVYELRTFVRPGAGQVGRLRLSCRGNLQSEISTNTADPSSPPSTMPPGRRRPAPRTGMAAIPARDQLLIRRQIQPE